MEYGKIKAIEHVNAGKKICWARGNKTCDGGKKLLKTHKFKI